MKIELTLNPADYSAPPHCPHIYDKCIDADLKIVERPNQSISDILEEIALSDADISTLEDLGVVLSSRFRNDYYVRAVEAENLIENGYTGYELIEKTIKHGLYLYYIKGLYDNLTAILTNVLIDFSENSEVTADEPITNEQWQKEMDKFIQQILLKLDTTADFLFDKFKLHMLLKLGANIVDGF